MRRLNRTFTGPREGPGLFINRVSRTQNCSLGHTADNSMNSYSAGLVRYLVRLLSSVYRTSFVLCAGRTCQSPVLHQGTTSVVPYRRTAASRSGYKLYSSYFILNLRSSGKARLALHL